MKTFSEFLKEEEDGEGALKYVKKVDGKWALVSRFSGKALKYFDGDEKPSREAADKALKTVEYYKHGGK